MRRRFASSLWRVGTRAVDEVTVRRQQVALQQPRDCGAMQPPQGLSGIMHWLERDP